MLIVHLNLIHRLFSELASDNLANILSLSLIILSFSLIRSNTYPLFAPSSPGKRPEACRKWPFKPSPQEVEEAKGRLKRGGIRFRMGGNFV